MFFEPQNFVINLKYMGLGMLAIFIVIGVIVVVTALLNFFTRKNASQESKSEEEK